MAGTVAWLTTAPVAAATTAAVWVWLWVSTPTGDLDDLCQHVHRVVLVARRMTWSVPVRDLSSGETWWRVSTTVQMDDKVTAASCRS